MRYLLDTHALLWYFEDSPKLSDTAAAIIENSEAKKYVSVASMWEFTIKNSLDKLSFEGGIFAFWNMVISNGFSILPISKSYLARLGQLPFLHRDPFDRILVATAIAEGMTLVSADENIHQYTIQWTW